MMTTTPRVVRITLVFLLLAFTSVTLAHNKVVVIPLSGEDLKPVANVITVAKKNGDFTSPVAAIASITDASSTNPYLLIIAPGVYDIGSEQIVMKEYVEIAGSGQNATIIRGSVSSNAYEAEAALLVGANNASIRDLTIKNLNGMSSYTFGVFNDLVSPTISNTTITVSGGSYQIGVLNERSSTVVSDTAIIVLGGTAQYGIYNRYESTVSLSETVITVSSGNGVQRGIYNIADSSATLSGSTIAVSGGYSDQWGVFNNAGSSTIMSDSTLTVVGYGSNAYGVFNISHSSSSIIRDSIISAPSASVRASTGVGATETYILGSILSGSITGDPKCGSSFMSNGAKLDSNCALTP